MMRFRKIISLLLLLSLLAPELSYGFCGFYVAKADATLFNQSSQVIIVRDGLRTTLTMFNDYQGEVKDFAMVVPVPVVLKKHQIRTVGKDLFTAFDGYSGPRLVEYYDENPCKDPVEYLRNEEVQVSAVMGFTRREGRNEYKVKVEAQYLIDGYDIIILSAQESGGLERWLTDNGYKIPANAKEVLEPYIQANLKFFVVKVALDQPEVNNSFELKPLQISFDHAKFMLPIRLGMANANGNQDLIIYTLTRLGRVEPTNYRMAAMPTDNRVPEFVKSEFGKFYKAVYERAWNQEGGASLMLEYAWDISGTQSTKCDPCPQPPLSLQQLVTAGCDWLEGVDWSTDAYLGELYFTRIHARYNRGLYPQDLMFQQTPNRENFQARYVLTHPASGFYDCAEAIPYLESVINRRRQELNTLNQLTGWDVQAHESYVKEYELKYKNVSGHDFIPAPTLPWHGPGGPNSPGAPGTSPYTLLFVLGLVFTTGSLILLRKRIIPNS